MEEEGQRCKCHVVLINLDIVDIYFSPPALKKVSPKLSKQILKTSVPLLVLVTAM